MIGIDWSQFGDVKQLAGGVIMAIGVILLFKPQLPKLFNAIKSAMPGSKPTPADGKADGLSERFDQLRKDFEAFVQRHEECEGENEELDGLVKNQSVQIKALEADNARLKTAIGTLARNAAEVAS